jgi:hypothetical protein
MNETGNGGVSTEENDKLRNKLIGSWTVNQSAQHVMYLFDDRQAGRWLEDGHTERSFAYEVISANIETLTMIIKFDSGSSFHLKAKISISGPSGPFGISEYWDKLSNLSMIHPEGRAS